MALRQRVWIDKSVQGVLIGRVIIYWIAVIIFLGGSVLCGQWWMNPDWSLEQHAATFVEQVWPWTPSVLLLLPLVVFDVVRLSHQFAGPVYRLRNHLRAMQQDPATSPLSFRDGDYWQDLVAPINWLQGQLLQRDEKIKALEFVLKSQTTASLTETYDDKAEEPRSSELTAV